MRVWADDLGSYASNEICLNWNAPLVFILAGSLPHPLEKPVRRRIPRAE